MQCGEKKESKARTGNEEEKGSPAARERGARRRSRLGVFRRGVPRRPRLRLRTMRTETPWYARRWRRRRRQLGRASPRAGREDG